MLSKIAQKAQDLLATPDPFAAWLGAKAETQSVGLSIACANCPLYNFLEQQGCEPRAVFGDYLEIEPRPSRFSTLFYAEVVSVEPWAGKFVRHIDAIGGEQSVEVTAGAARETLAEVLALVEKEAAKKP